MSVVFSKGQKYCTNCKWCEPADNRDDWKCLHPKNISVDLVTGRVLISFFHIDFLREIDSGGCGLQGKWFEKRKISSKTTEETVDDLAKNFGEDKRLIKGLLDEMSDFTKLKGKE